MTTRIAYKSIELTTETRVFNGRTRTRDVCDVNGTTITRIIDGPVDVFCIKGPNVVEGIEINASHVVAGVRKHATALVGKGGKALKEEPAEA